jgi:hypothetical protein
MRVEKGQIKSLLTDWRRDGCGRKRQDEGDLGEEHGVEFLKIDSIGLIGLFDWYLDRKMRADDGTDAFPIRLSYLIYISSKI